MIWEAMPQHRRTETRLRLLRWSAQVTTVLARRTGAASIAREAVTGERRYEVPYRLSVARLALEQAYDRGRDVST
jgi:hypothetical protein